ncbi:MAG: 50S ribosomal protein L18 [Nannocystaceae bacterium]|nr:50S ribosomal protein L18 [bacterium]
MATQRQQSRFRRKKRIRKKVSGTSERPRLTIFRSNKHIYAQVIDDMTASSLAAASDLKVGGDDKDMDKTARAKAVGAAIASACLDKGIKQVVFDRNGYAYHGRVNALAAAAREAGLEF